MIILSALVLTINAGAQQTTAEGIKMYHYGKTKTAQKILEPLAVADALANYYLGLSYLEQGDVFKASATFSKFPEDPANISGTARVAFTNKDASKGMQIAKELAAKSKKKEWIQEKYAADAITYTIGGDYRQAIAWYTDALTKNDDMSAHIGLGDANRKIQGGGGEAMNNYEHVTEKDANNSLGYTRIGDLWYEAKNYPSALDNYAKAKNADSTNPLPYRSLADAYTRSGNYQLALQNLKKYLQLSDNTSHDKLEYTEALFRAHSFCDAAKLAGQQINDFPDLTTKTELYGILGFSQAECGDSIQAIKTIRIYLGMQDPKKVLPGDYVNIGKLYLKAGMLDSAGAFYAKGISGDTAQNKTDIYRQIAEAYKAKKDYCHSADWYNNLVKANPETQATDYFWRVFMYYYCNDLKTAMNAANEFAAKYNIPSAIYSQARVAAAMDSTASTGGAAEYFNKWIDMVGPNYEKKNDLKGAYSYLMYYAYNSKNKEKVSEYKEKIKAIDPNDRSLKDIEEIEKAANAPKKQAPAPKGKK